MTTVAPARVRGSHAPAPTRHPPSPRDLLSRLGRALRFVVGVDEELMDRVRWERASHASLGGVVVLTAVIAAFSMWFAVEQAAGSGVWGALLPAAIWMLFIYNMDRLIVTTRATGGWHRWVMLVGRGIIAVLLGIIIAEPLVLRVFQTQIEDTVRSDRAARLAQLETSLEQCNPDPADPVAKPGPECTAEHRLSITVNPAARAAELTNLRAQAKTLADTISTETAEIARLNDLAAKECNGTPGPGLSGRYGEGINCRTNRENARQYEESVPLAAQQAQMNQLNERIAELESDTKTSREEYAKERANLIAKRLADQTQVDEPIGLLERMEALSRISGSNGTLALGIWLVRLLFIAIDCSPVLMKLTSGRSRYDELVAASLDDAVKTHRILLEGKDSERAMAMEDREQLRREHAIAMQQRVADAVDARAAAYERQARDEQRAAEPQ